MLKISTKAKVLLFTLFLVLGISGVSWVVNGDNSEGLEEMDKLRSERLAYVSDIFEEASVYERHAPNTFSELLAMVRPEYFILTSNDERYHVEVWEKGDSFNHNLTPIEHPLTKETTTLNKLMIQSIKEHDKQLTEEMK